jgi:hypothetical protein
MTATHGKFPQALRSSLMPKDAAAPVVRVAAASTGARPVAIAHSDEILPQVHLLAQVDRRAVLFAPFEGPAKRRRELA